MPFDFLTLLGCLVLLWVVHARLQDRMVPSLLILGAAVAVSLAARPYLDPEVAVLALLLWLALLGGEGRPFLAPVLLCAVVVGTVAAQLALTDVFFFSTPYPFLFLGIVGVRLVMGWIQDRALDEDLDDDAV